MEELQELNRELKNPGLAKLLIAARRRGIKAIQADAKEVQSSTKQFFAQPPSQGGAHATNENGASWQADLASLVQYSAEANKNYSYFLLVVDVFSREVRTEPLQTKSPKKSGKPLRIYATIGARSRRSAGLTTGRNLGVGSKRRRSIRTSRSTRRSLKTSTASRLQMRR